MNSALPRLDASARSQAGSSLFAAILITLLVSVLSASFLADSLAEVRMSIKEIEHRSTIRAARSMLRLALAELRQFLLDSGSLNWNSLLSGPNGRLESCSPPDLNPVRPSDISRALLGSVCNSCGDDGVLVQAFNGSPIVGKAGLLLFRGDRQLYRLNSLPETHPCGYSSDPENAGADFQAWFKLSDNPELDGDLSRDNDGLAILRVVVAGRVHSASAGMPSSQGFRNTVVTLEAWLKVTESSSLQAVAVREITY